MQNFISNIEIHNFKSIRHCSFQDFRRINLFIGKPNVGKSNILEALSLFTLPYLKRKTKLSAFIRVKTPAELFFNGNIEEAASFRSQAGDWTMHFHPKEGLAIVYSYADFGKEIIHIDSNLNLLNTPLRFQDDLPIKKYTYKTDVHFKKSHSRFLEPPFGQNLLDVLQNFSGLKREVESLFSEYSLQMVFDLGSQNLLITKKGNFNDGSVFLIPYNSIADTLQRIIFYKAAIVTNDNSILIFEEPEAHSFPPYMSHITQEMIHKKDNQYFVATHSPFILNDLLENGMDDLAVFMVSYENNETVAKALSRDELHEVYQYGVDLFTNGESYI